MSEKKNKTPPFLSAEDAALWDAVTSNVDPLGKRKPVHQEKAKARHSEAGAINRIPRGFDASLSPSSQHMPTLRHDFSPGVDRATLKKVKRGNVPVEGKLDLHGMTQTDARGALERFLAFSQEKGRRLVLVVTGRGFRGEGVLRQAVPEWLNAPPNRSRILSFSYASPTDGGDGALYVLLKRKR